MRVLVVEDEPTHLKLAHLVLESAGLKVVEVRTAEDALQVIANDPPEVILLDLKLPGMSGVELARRLKLDPQSATIPIVAVTAYAEHYSRSKALEAGCNAYLQKPLDTHTLADRVRAAAQRAA